MKLKLIAGLLLAGAFPLVFSACKDDEDPKSGISFELTEQEVTESNGTLSSFHPDLFSGSKGHDVIVKLVLDRPLSEAVVLKYTLSGTAIEENPADGNNVIRVNDYALKDGVNTSVASDKITISKGATEATLKLTVYEDDDFEVTEETDSETAILTINGIESGPAVLGANVTYTLTIREDDSIIFLTWMDEETEEVGDIDMDLFIWNEGIIIGGSASENPTDPADAFEAVLLPGGYPEGDYGLSYTYYSGTSDNVLFAAIMFGYFNNDYYPLDFTSEDLLVYAGIYGLANVNTYGYDQNLDEFVPAPKIVQTLTKDGIYYNASEIEIPAEGSRTSGDNPVASNLQLKKLKSVPSASIINQVKLAQSRLKAGLIINKK